MYELEILKLETEINQMEESNEKNIKIELLNQKQQALEVKGNTLELAKKLADTAIEILNKAIDLSTIESYNFILKSWIYAANINPIKALI